MHQLATIRQGIRNIKNTPPLEAVGIFISRAVDVSEVAKKRFLDNTIDVKNIHIDSEEFKNNEGRQVRVSNIEITLKKK